MCIRDRYKISGYQRWLKKFVKLDENQLKNLSQAKNLEKVKESIEFQKFEESNKNISQQSSEAQSDLPSEKLSILSSDHQKKNQDANENIVPRRQSQSVYLKGQQNVIQKLKQQQLLLLSNDTKKVPL
eukprot:TRINITY_DN7917_c0_g1_i1.p3 TRINITY_DN7917_c0_g1~~TRINITY_DN7917_c0_g1_i1.p3  ORF type:complete len:128 (+),score=24.28 TRINITY_DN7917_c0_g1_i1:119-502(+)